MNINTDPLFDDSSSIAKKKKLKLTVLSPLSEFRGFEVFFDSHYCKEKPLVYVNKGEVSVLVSISDYEIIKCIKGKLNNEDTAIIEGWVALREEELLENWVHFKRNEKFDKVEGI